MVENHWNSPELVVISLKGVKGKKVSVAADDLERAIKNASN